MFIRKVRRKCSMRGCRCTDSFAFSLSNEMGNSIIACKNCILEAAKAVENYKEEEAPKKKAPREIPPLFFNAKAMDKAKVDDGVSADLITVDEAPVVTEPVVPEEQTEPEVEPPAEEKEPTEPVKPAPKPQANKKKGVQKK